MTTKACTACEGTGHVTWMQSGTYSVAMPTTGGKAITFPAEIERPRVVHCRSCSGAGFIIEPEAGDHADQD